MVWHSNIGVECQSIIGNVCKAQGSSRDDPGNPGSTGTNSEALVLCLGDCFDWLLELCSVLNSIAPSILFSTRLWASWRGLGVCFIRSLLALSQRSDDIGCWLSELAVWSGTWSLDFPVSTDLNMKLMRRQPSFLSTRRGHHALTSEPEGESKLSASPGFFNRFISSMRWFQYCFCSARFFKISRLHKAVKCKSRAWVYIWWYFLSFCEQACYCSQQFSSASNVVLTHKNWRKKRNDRLFDNTSKQLTEYISNLTGNKYWLPAILTVLMKAVGKSLPRSSL